MEDEEVETESIDYALKCGKKKRKGSDPMARQRWGFCCCFLRRRIFEHVEKEPEDA